MPFDIRDHLEALNHLGRGRYNCPVCNSKNFTINKKSGAYKCWANECDNAHIRNAIAPIDSDVCVEEKTKTSPKPKAKPIKISDAADIQLGQLPEDRKVLEGRKIGAGTKTFYDYGDGHIVERTDKKKGKTIYPTFKSDPTDNGEGYSKGKGDRPWDAYRLNEALEFAAGKWVVVVEGEKCVEAMREIRIPTITFNGSGWKNDDFSLAISRLKGSCEGLVVIPDNDKPGQKKAAEVLAACASHSYPCLVLNPLDIWAEMPPDGGDVANWVEYWSCADEETKENLGTGLNSYYFSRINAAIAKAFEDQSPVAAIAETSKPLTPHKPESKAVHRGSKPLNPRELLDFVQNEFGDSLAFNDLTCDVLLDEKPLRFGSDLKFWFLDNYGESASKDDIYDCLTYEAKRNSFNPVERYLTKVHRSAKRVDITNISSRYFGTEDPIFDRMCEMWLISAVARVLHPGAQVDHTLVLQSGQGKYKSTFFATLAGDWFSDSVKDIENKDSLLTLHSSWIVELSEIDRITSKKQAGALKHFLTQKEDTFRKPYAKEVERNPRRAIFCGTVNPTRFLVDDENRRFWVIPVSDKITGIDISMLERERDGIWAAAYDALLAGQVWYPTDEEKLSIARMNKSFEDVDVWQELVENWIQHKPFVSVHEILAGLFKMEESLMDRRDQMRVAKVLSRLGWNKESRKVIYGKSRRVRFNPEYEDGQDIEEWHRKMSQNHPSEYTNIDGKVGKVGKTLTQQSLRIDQPLYQPLERSVGDGRSVMPTSTNEVGQSQTSVQQGFYQPTDLTVSIPQRYRERGFMYPLESRVVHSVTSETFTLEAFPEIGSDFAKRRYLCLGTDGESQWIEQQYLTEA